jgi:hypothetical protein
MPLSRKAASSAFENPVILGYARFLNVFNNSVTRGFGREKRMALSLDTLVIHLIVNIIVLSPVLWISGRLLAGKDKAKFTDALWIVVLGTVINAVFLYFFTGLIATIIVLVIWLALVKHFFDTGWLRALAIAIVAILFLIVIAFIIGLIFGIAILGGFV